MDLDHSDSDVSDDSAILMDPYSSCDDFRMFEFKVRRCPRGRSHDWTDCPYAHPGEKARRRDPRKYNYSSTPCAEFRKGSGCKKGDGCELAHGVFECWLHPARYRTQPCKDGAFCKRKVCFFAHTTEQLRFMINSPPDTPTGESPPMFNSLRNQQLGKFKSLPRSWNVQVGGGSGFGSMIRPGFFSLPTTPSPRAQTNTGFGFQDFWDEVVHQEGMMERVESGKDLRAKIFEKLSKENLLNRVNPDQDPKRSANTPDVGWVSELLE